MISINKRLSLLLFCFAALFTMGMVFYATNYGPGVGGDATIYLTSAQNLNEGKGLGWTEADGSFRLLPYTPPFYPLVLSAIGLVGDMLAGARFINILLSGLLVFFLGWAFLYFTNQHWLAVILAGLIATSPVLLGVQVWAMSEVLFISLGFSGLVVTLFYLKTNRRTLLLLSAVLLGLSFLTRYMGLAFVTTGGLAVLFLKNSYHGSHNIRTKSQDKVIRFRATMPVLREGIFFGIVAILPMVIWLIIDFSITGTVGSRSGQPVSEYWQRFLEIGPALQDIYLFWLVPDSIVSRLPGMIKVAAWLIPLVVVIGITVLVLHRPNEIVNSTGVNNQSYFVFTSRLVILFSLFVIVYLVVLAIAQVFTFPPITLASRMLSPVHLAILVILCGLISLVWATFAKKRRLVMIVLALGLLLMLASYLMRSMMIADNYHQTGIGYNELAWQNSSTMKALEQLPGDVPLISNEITAIMYLAGRPAYALQEIYQNQPSPEPFSKYGAGDDPAQIVFREQNGALVLFSANLKDDFAMYGDLIEQRLNTLTDGLFIYHTSEDGAIYFWHEPDFDLPAP